jgi:hypothetical protein
MAHVGGQTLESTNYYNHPDSGELVVDFGVVLGGHRLCVRVAGRPELESQIAAIEGLAELEQAYAKRERLGEEFERMMETEAPRSIPTGLDRAEESIEELSTRYPRAALYLRAQGYLLASHDAKVQAGKDAIELILDGQDAQAIERLNGWANALALD